MKSIWRRCLVTVLTTLLIMQSFTHSGLVSAEIVEQTMATFSTADRTDNRLLSGKTFYSDWKTADGFPSNTQTGQGVNLSGTAANGAHKKMFLKTTLTLTALDDTVDVTTCWKSIGFRLRSANLDGSAQEASFYYLYPADVTMTNGTIEVSIPLSKIQASNIDWSDVRQLNTTCEVIEAYHLPDTGNSDKLSFTQTNTRIVRELVAGEVDTEELEDLVVTTIVEADFTPESVAVWKQAIADGEALLQAATISQEAVDATAKSIKDARRNLVSSKVTYKGKLQELLDEVITGEPGAALIAYENAKKAAQPLMEDATATQKQVNQAVLDIVKAKMDMTFAVPDEDFTTIGTFSKTNGSFVRLQSGKQYATNWQRLDGITDTTTAQPGLDVSGTANNGSDMMVYLQLRMAYTPLSEEADITDCWKHIAIRLRSSSIDGKNQEADFFYLTPDQVAVDHGNGVYTVRVPLRVITTTNINWSDLKELNFFAELKPAHHLLGDDGSTKEGDSTDIGFTLSGVSLVRKTARLKGDLDSDKEVSANDALLVLQAATEKIVLPTQDQDVADVDGTAGIAAGDALLVLQRATSKIDDLGTVEEKERKMVAFTFDDGPSDNTAAFLDALKERNARVSFFVIGEHVEQYPELVKRMADEGHAVGNHSYSHNGPGMTSPEIMIAEYKKCSDSIEKYTGNRPTLMRAVGGTSADGILDFVIAENMRLCGCIGGGPDYAQTDPQVVFDYFMKDGKCTISDGDILLLHETSDATIEAALRLIDLLQADGYEIVTLQEMMDARVDGGVAGVKYDRVVSLK